MFSALVILLLIGVPIAYAIGASGILYLLLSNPVFLLTMPQRVWSGTESFIIIAMPLFMLTGELMNHSGLTRRLIDFAMLTVRPARGGLGEVNVVASMIFGGISGSSVADTSALGSILIPDMVRKGYPKGFSAGITVASSTIGMVIPPSVPMLMYAMISGASVGKLFLAGLLPGVLVGLTQLVLTYTISAKRGYHPPKERTSFTQAAKVTKDGALAVLMPLLIIVTVSGGVATASESAGVAVLYAAILGFFVYRELKWKDVFKALKKTFMMSSSIMIIGGFTMIFTWILAVEQVPAMIGNFLVSSEIPWWVVFIFLDLLILVLGTFLDVTPMHTAHNANPTAGHAAVRDERIAIRSCHHSRFGDRPGDSSCRHVSECGEQDLWHVHHRHLQIRGPFHRLQYHHIVFGYLCAGNLALVAVIDVEREFFNRSSTWKYANL